MAEYSTEEMYRLGKELRATQTFTEKSGNVIPKNRILKFLFSLKGENAMNFSHFLGALPGLLPSLTQLAHHLRFGRKGVYEVAEEYGCEILSERLLHLTSLHGGIFNELSGEVRGKAFGDASSWLVYAIQYDRADWVEYLLKKGHPTTPSEIEKILTNPDVGVQNIPKIFPKDPRTLKVSDSPFHSCLQNYNSKKAEIIKLLVEHKIDLNFNVEGRSTYEWVCEIPREYKDEILELIKPVYTIPEKFTDSGNKALLEEIQRLKKENTKLRDVIVQMALKRLEETEEQTKTLTNCVGNILVDRI